MPRRKEIMYFLERKETIAKPNILGNCSFPVYSERWKAIMACEDREPLKKELAKHNPNKYRITSNKEEQPTVGGISDGKEFI